MSSADCLEIELRRVKEDLEECEEELFRCQSETKPLQRELQHAYDELEEARCELEKQATAAALAQRREKQARKEMDKLKGGPAPRAVSSLSEAKREAALQEGRKREHTMRKRIESLHAKLVAAEDARKRACKESDSMRQDALEERTSKQVAETSKDYLLPYMDVCNPRFSFLVR